MTDDKRDGLTAEREAEIRKWATTDVLVDGAELEQALPELLAEVDRLRAELDELRARLKPVRSTAEPVTLDDERAQPSAVPCRHAADRRRCLTCRPSAVIVAAKSDVEALRKWLKHPQSSHIVTEALRALQRKHDDIGQGLYDRAYGSLEALSRATILDRAELVAWLRGVLVRMPTYAATIPPALRALLGDE